MWNTKINNIICWFFDAYDNQKKHIQRVLSAKKITDNNKKPIYPYFLKQKITKKQIEEEKNEQIKKENKELFIKILTAEEKASKYSKIKQKKYPSFKRENILFARIQQEISKNKENIRFYNKIKNIKSNYDNEELNIRNKTIRENKKKLHKSIYELQPSLLFLSPSRVKKEIEKINKISFSNNNKMKRSNSCCCGMEIIMPKTTKNSKINNSILKWENLGKIEKENTNRKIIKINKFLKNKIKKYKAAKKNSIKLNNQKILKKSCNKSSVVDETKKNNNSINDVRENNTNKEKKVKGTLKRNVSQADLFNIE